MAVLIWPVMADRGQSVATAWTPRAQLALIVLCTSRREVEDALLPLRSPAHALPPTRSPSLAKPLLAIADAASFATVAHLQCRAFGQSILGITTSSSTPPPGPLALSL